MPSPALPRPPREIAARPSTGPRPTESGSVGRRPAAEAAAGPRAWASSPRRRARDALRPAAARGARRYPCASGAARGRCGGTRGRAEWKARGDTPPPRPVPPPSSCPCGSGRGPRAAAPRTARRCPGRKESSLAASPRRGEAALECALEGAQHALEAIDGSGEAFAFLVRDLQLGDADRRLGAMQGLHAEPVGGGLLQPRPELLELLEELLRLLLASRPLRRLLLAEHPLLVGLGGGRDLLLGEAGGGGDGDALPEAGLHVDGGDGDDAVGGDVEDDVDVDLAALGLAQSGHHELAEQLVLGGDLALALQHGDLRRGLIVLDGGEDVVGAGRDGGVLRDDALAEAAGDGH